MTRHGPTVLVSDQEYPLISIGGVMSDERAGLREPETPVVGAETVCADLVAKAKAKLRRSLAERLDDLPDIPSRTNGGAQIVGLVDRASVRALLIEDER